MKRIAFLILILLVIGCKNEKRTLDILPLDSMKVVMFDFMIANAWNNTRSETDTSFLKLKNNLKAYQQVLVIHHISKAVFDSSLNYYEQRPQMFKTLFDSINAYGSRLKDTSIPKQGKPLLKKTGKVVE